LTNKNKTKQPIIIDLSIDNATSLDRNQLQSLLHASVYEKLVNSLQNKLQATENHSLCNQSEIDSSNSYIDEIHSAIFLDGERGSGKTFFLKNIELYLGEKNPDMLDQLYFFNPIDPTILHKNESFLTIIIAKILNRLRNKIEQLKENEKRNFYDSLRTLAESIDATLSCGDNKCQSAIKMIAIDQSGLSLRDQLNDFLCLIRYKVLGGKKLVLLIDDVDMAFDHGFEVLEVLRKYLSCSHVIPIVTGDIELYRQIVKSHFIKNLEKPLEYPDNIDEIDFDIKEYDFAIKKYQITTYSELTRHYLSKLFPRNHRIYIKRLCETMDFNGLSELFIEEFNKIDGEERFISKIESQPFNIVKLKYSEHKHDNYLNLSRAIYNFFKNFDSLDTDQKNLHQFCELTLRESNQLFLGEKKYFMEAKHEDASIDELYRITRQYGIFKQHKEKYKLYLESARKSIKRGNLEKANDDIENALLLVPTSKDKRDQAISKSIELLNSLARESSKIGENEQSVNMYNKIIAYTPNDVKLYEDLAKVYVILEQYDQAITAYQKAIVLKPDDSNLYIQLSKENIRLKKHENAISIMKNAIELIPNNVHLYTQLGLAYDEATKYTESIASYQKALELKPNDVYLYILLGSAYTEAEKYDKSIVSYQKALELKPNDISLIYQLGYTLQKNKEYDEAKKLYLHSIKLKPDDYYLYQNLGDVYSELAEYDEAIVVYEKAVTLKPDSAYLYDVLGWIYDEVEMYSESIKAYTKAIDLEPNEAHTYNNLGWVYSKINNFDKAIISYLKALEIDSTFYVAYHSLCSAYYSIKEYDKAIKICLKAIELNDSDSTNYTMLGTVYDKKDMFDQSIQAYTKAIELKPDDVGNYMLIGYMYVNHNMYDEAIQSFKLAVNYNDENHTSYHNIIALELVTGKELDSDIIEAFKIRFSDDERSMAEFEILIILDEAKNGVNIEERILEWKNNYSHIRDNEFSLDIQYTWVENYEYSEEIKNTLIHALNTFNEILHEV
jgi:tetratricopeptide (TPR) repeat protein